MTGIVSSFDDAVEEPRRRLVCDAMTSRHSVISLRTPQSTEAAA